MSDIEYGLFRAKFIKPYQTSFLHEDLSPRDIFRRAINERPSAELIRDHIWHIGNIRSFSEYTGYFAIGRTTNATIEKYDTKSGDFVEETLETSPYTHVVFDASIGLLGIAKKTRLAPSSKGIASKIEKLLSQTTVVIQNDISVEIAPVPDPEGFLRAIASAYRVTRFTATFSGPNPIDADEIFQKPLSVYLAAANGDVGHTQVQGEDLNKETIQEVARSTAATGNQASARITRARFQKSITINLAGDPVRRRYDEDGHDPERVLHDLTAAFQRIRTSE